MALRYWVGGSGTWDATTTTNWSASSGGAGGASAPTSADDVVFNSSSGAAPTVTIGTNAACGAVTITAPTSGTLTFAFSTTGIISYNGNWSNPASLFATTGAGPAAGGIVYVGSGSSTLTTNGYSFPTAFGVNTSAGTLTLGGALTSTSSLVITQGTFTTNNFNVTASSLSSSNTNTRTINLGSSTVTLSSITPITFTTSTGLTFNAGTSTIALTPTSGATFNGSFTYYNVTFPAASASNSITGTNTFNNVTFAAPTSSGVSIAQFNADQTINGTLTFSASSNATMRTFVRSGTIGTARTLTCAAVAAPTDIDFRDITIAGAAAPVSGTRLGDCKGNSGITFGAGTTKYWNLAAGGTWQSTAWATSSGGAANISNFPLAQDTAVFEATGLTSGNTITINTGFNIGTIDMSARTSNTMTLAVTGSPAIYGNLINGTGTTLSGTGTFTFAGRGSQTITSAGKTFTQGFTIDTPSGSVTLQDALTTSGQITLTQGTFATSNFNATFNSFTSTNTNTRTISLGSSTVTLTGSGVTFNASVSTNLTVTGTSTISLTSASAKTFAGGGYQSYPTINQGGAGALTITGSNTFGNITNTYNATGATSILFTAATTSTFTAWNASGASGNLLTIASGTAATHTLSKTSGIVSADYLSLTNSIATGGATWYAGANSTNVSGNTGWIFTAPPASGNTSSFFLMF